MECGGNDAALACPPVGCAGSRSGSAHRTMPSQRPRRGCHGCALCSHAGAHLLHGCRRRSRGTRRLSRDGLLRQRWHGPQAADAGPVVEADAHRMPPGQSANGPTRAGTPSSDREAPGLSRAGCGESPSKVGLRYAAPQPTLTVRCPPKNGLLCGRQGGNPPARCPFLVGHLGLRMKKQWATELPMRPWPHMQTTKTGPTSGRPAFLGAGHRGPSAGFARNPT